MIWFSSSMEMDFHDAATFGRVTIRAAEPHIISQWKNQSCHVLSYIDNWYGPQPSLFLLSSCFILFLPLSHCSAVRQFMRGLQASFCWRTCAPCSSVDSTTYQCRNTSSYANAGLCHCHGRRRHMRRYCLCPSEYHGLHGPPSQWLHRLIDPKSEQTHMNCSHAVMNTVWHSTFHGKHYSRQRIRTTPMWSARCHKLDVLLERIHKMVNFAEKSFLRSLVRTGYACNANLCGTVSAWGELHPLHSRWKDSVDGVRIKDLVELLDYENMKTSTGLVHQVSGRVQ